MKKRSMEQRFAREVTRGLWILPWRRREARREILEHLEDLAEERGVSRWTKEALEREFGARKQLCKLYKKSGVPLWGKFLKFAVGCIGLILFLLAAIDLGILWFYPIEPGYIQLMRSNDPYAKGLRQGKLDLPKVDVQWMEEGDSRSQELLDALVECKSIFERHSKSVENARQSFLEKQRQEWIARGIVGATKARMIADSQQKFLETMFPKDSENKGSMAMPGMMGMGAMPEDQAEEILLYETADPKFVVPPLPKEDFNKVIQLWTRSTENDRLRIPREMATDRDVEQLQTFLKNKGKSPESGRTSVNMDANWLGTIMAFHTLDTEIDMKESIQRAKDLTAANVYCEKYVQLLQILVSNIPGNAPPNYRGVNIAGSEELTDLQIADILEASARWTRLFLEAIRPNPEPFIDYLFLISSIDITSKALKNRVDSPAQISTYRGVLQELSRIEIAFALEPLERQPQFDSVYRIPSMWKHWAYDLSRMPLFKAQCSAMQWICGKESDAFYRYEVLKNYIGTMLVSLSSPNHRNVLVRSKIVLSEKALAQSVMAFQQWLDDPNRKSGFDPKPFGIADPFQPEGPKFHESESTYEFRCAGPDETFGNGIYDPSNGIDSSGDIVWTMKR